MAKRPFLALVEPDAGDAAASADAARTLIERAYSHLRDDIVEGVLAPGEKLRVEHLKARYGDFVLYKPELGSRTWLLWFGPFVLLVGGAGLVVLIQRRVRAAPSTPAALAEKDRARADKLLDE